MTASQATEWMLPIALAAAVFSGLLIVAVSVRTSWIKSAIAFTTVAYALLGGFLTLSPKWHSLTAKYDGKSGSVEVASLQKQLTDSQSENAQLKSQISLVTQLGKRGTKADDWVTLASQVKTEVDWAKFLPVGSNTAMVKVQFDDSALGALATKLGKPADEVGTILNDSGFTFLKPYNADDLKKVPASDLWVNPVSR